MRSHGSEAANCIAQYNRKYMNNNTMVIIETVSTRRIAGRTKPKTFEGTAEMENGHVQSQGRLLEERSSSLTVSLQLFRWRVCVCVYKETSQPFHFPFGLARVVRECVCVQHPTNGPEMVLLLPPWLVCSRYKPAACLRT